MFERYVASRTSRAVSDVLVGATVAAIVAGTLGCEGDSESRDPLPPRATETICLASIDLDDVDGTMPALLSETGCFVETAEEVPAPDMIPFGVNAELWTDGAHKARFVAIPAESTIVLTDQGPWQLPVGSKIVKVFRLDVVTGTAEEPVVTRVPVETRFMVLGNDGWHYFSYMWNDERTDATLMPEGMARVVPYDTEVDGERRAISYQFPDRYSCTTCHGDAPGEVIGLRTRQLNGRYDYGGVRANQLEALESIGVFAAPLAGDVDELARQPNPFGKKGTLEERARAYLDTHCASCHQPGGWTAGDINLDLRYETPLAETNLCGERSLYPYPSGTGQYRLRPGKPEESNILGRMGVEGVGEIGEMPPLGRSIADRPGIALVREWIESMSACPERP